MGLANLDAWEETPAQYLSLPSTTLMEKAMNVIYINDVLGYNLLPLPLRQIYANHVIPEVDISGVNTIYTVEIMEPAPRRILLLNCNAKANIPCC